jgi:hypothetical protein
MTERTIVEHAYVRAVDCGMMEVVARSDCADHHRVLFIQGNLEVGTEGSVLYVTSHRSGLPRFVPFEVEGSVLRRQLDASFADVKAHAESQLRRRR